MYALIGVVVTLVISYLNKKVRVQVIPIEGDLFHLRLHKLYYYIGIGSVIFGCVGFILPTVLVETGDGWIVGLFFLLLFGVLGLLCVLLYVNHSFNFNTKHLESSNILAKKKSVLWEDIESIKFNPFSGYIVFRDNKSEKVKAHVHLVGITNLLNKMEEKTQWKKKDLKLPL
ncbi:MAG: hypothetical protein ACSHXL_04940 [Bacteroidota bacterium]